jgi:hypothetical protein
LKPNCRVALAVIAVTVLASAASPASASKIYFLEYDFDTLPNGDPLYHFSLNRANLDGSGREEVVFDMGEQPEYASLVVHDGRVYWNVLGGGQTRAATTDGVLLGAVTPPNAHVAAALRDRTLDAAGRYVYYAGPTEFGGVEHVVRADAGTGEADTLVETRRFSPNLSIALDESRGNIYWAGAWSGGVTGLLQRANLADGSGVETLLEDFASDDYTVDLEIDPEGGKLYWANSSLRTIQRMNLDGTGVEDVLEDVWASSVALDLTPVPEPGAAGVCAAAAGALLLRRRRGEAVMHAGVDAARADANDE